MILDRPRQTVWRLATGTALLLLISCSCSSETRPADSAKLNEFARRYTAAWCSQNAASVAACFTEDGALQINEGKPSVGRTAIAAAAQGFMTTFPDMIVALDKFGVDGAR